MINTLNLSLKIKSNAIKINNLAFSIFIGKDCLSIEFKNWISVFGNNLNIIDKQIRNNEINKSCKLISSTSIKKRYNYKKLNKIKSIVKYFDK